jgi:hypothetical protein
MNTFNGIEQQLCFIHFCKNIKDKMKYWLKKRPSTDQITKVIRLFHGVNDVKKIIDMTKKQLNET